MPNGQRAIGMLENQIVRSIQIEIPCSRSSLSTARMFRIHQSRRCERCSFHPPNGQRAVRVLKYEIGFFISIEVAGSDYSPMPEDTVL